jgi:hypothetical protein
MSISNNDDPTKTNVDAALAAAQKRFAGDPERAEMIARTRRFKSSWIELAEALTDCRKHEYWKKWNYRSFDDYYKRELRLKQATVDKLTGSYAFLRHSAPDVLNRDGVSDAIPGFESTDFLRRAEEAKVLGNATEETVGQVRQAVINDNMSLPRITKLFKESLFPEDTNEKARKRYKEADRTARKLSELISGLRDSLPAQVVQKVEDAVTLLLKSLPQDKEKGVAEHREAAASEKNQRRRESPSAAIATGNP